MKSSQTVFAVVALGVLAVCCTPAAAYYILYDYYVYATGSDGIPITDDDILTDQQTFLDGNYTKTGSYGNYGTAAFSVRFASATSSATAHAHGHDDDSDFYSGTGRVERAGFSDELFFTVPAGYYETGLQVGLTAYVRGTISSDVGAGAEARCYVSLGYDDFSTGQLTVGVDESGTIVVDEDIVLTIVLVMPGTTLNQTTVYDEYVTAGIARGRTWATSYNPGGGNVIGDGDIDFANGVRITSIDVPPGVTWTSESGVFLSAVSAAGDGSTAAPAPRLHQNHPNPFNPATTIAFDLAEDSRVDLRVYDVAGRLVRTLVNGERLGTGLREEVWHGRDEAGAAVATGVYFYELIVGERRETKRMVLIR